MEAPRTSSLVIFTVLLALLGIFVLVQIYQIQVPVEFFEPTEGTEPVGTADRSPAGGRSYLQIANRNLRMRIDRLERQLEETQTDYESLQQKYNELLRQHVGGSSNRWRNSGGSEPTEGDLFDTEMLDLLASLQDEVNRLKAENARLKQQASGTAQPSEADASMQATAPDGASQDLETALESLSEENSDFRTALAAVLIELGPQAVPALVNLLQHDRPAIREWAAYVLGAMGRSAEAALPALGAALQDPDASVVEAARQSIGAIESAE